MKTSLIAFGVVFVIVAGLVTYGYKRTPIASSVATPAVTQTVSSTSTSSYLSTQVKAHSSGADCWTIVDGKVYDVTSWINRHPGGSAAILSMCGRDASASFDRQHGGQGRPASELAGFLIGTLVQ